MGDENLIVQGENCPKARWIYRGICMLASVSWFIMTALEHLWPEFSSRPEQKQDGPGGLVFSAPFLIYIVVVVRSFYLPVPTSSDIHGDLRLLLSIFLAFTTIGMCGVSTRRSVEGPIVGISCISGMLSAFLLEWPVKDLSVQHVVYTYFVLALMGYLGFQRPVWPACLFVVALVFVNVFLFYGLLRLDLPEGEGVDPEILEAVHNLVRMSKKARDYLVRVSKRPEEEEDYKDSPV